MILRTAIVAAAALAATSATPAHAGGVESAEYTFGDAAFHIDGYRDGTLTKIADIELTAKVHYPKRLGQGHPLVVLAHGLWATCKTTGLQGWPCEPGVQPVPSYRGYDYLGRELAARGFVVVSVSANGVNAGEMGQAQDRARALLVGKHLTMWRDLAATGGGELAGKLPVDFRGRVDLTNVGTMGHSRGGRGAVWQASDNHAADMPEGVRIKAVVPLAPAEYYAPDAEAPENLDYRVTKIPVGGFTGTCDHSVDGARPYFDNAKGRTEQPLHLFTVDGANHNFYNTEWSYTDDAIPAGPGRCVTYGENSARQLTKAEQRQVATTYLSAFYRRYLQGDTSVDRLLTQSRPGVTVETA